MIKDHCEAYIFDMLTLANEPFVQGDKHPSRLDFYLPNYNIFIEVKQFHSNRIAEQMSREHNVIALQGVESCILFGDMLKSYIKEQKTNEKLLTD
jgi:hypothetical protein